MKVWGIIKSFIYSILAIFICIFAKKIIGLEQENSFIHFLIGGLMITYGLEAIILHFALKKSIDENFSFYWGICEIILGTIVLIFIREAITIYVTWAVWSILREAQEIMETVTLIKEKIPAYFALVMSVIIIVFSILLLINPTNHHAKIHIYLLVGELITAIIFPQIYFIIKKQTLTPKPE